MKRSVYLSLIKELTLEIKADKYSLILLMQRGYIYLQNKNYQKAIEDFNTVIKRNGQIDTRIYSYRGGQGTYFLQKNNLYKTCLFRSSAFALSGDFEKFSHDYIYLLKSDCEMEYTDFLIFSWSVLKDETEEAINRYSNLRSSSKELMDFEEDVFNLLPIENIEGLYESIKLIDFSLGITRKNKN